MNKSIVYVVQDPGDKNILPAEKHGQFCVILTGRETTEQAIRIMEKILSNITPQDFLLPLGHPINIGIATHLSLLYNRGVLNFLVWDRNKYTYNIETIIISDELDESNKSPNTAAHH